MRPGTAGIDRGLGRGGGGIAVHPKHQIREPTRRTHPHPRFSKKVREAALWTGSTSVQEEKRAPYRASKVRQCIYDTAFLYLRSQADGNWRVWRLGTVP
ncbi:hypothetical protein ACRRTK_007135 [Alexandromys fortis]